MFESLGCTLCEHVMPECIYQDGLWWADIPQCNLTGRTLIEENFRGGVTPEWCPFLPIEPCDCEDCRRSRGEI